MEEEPKPNEEQPQPQQNPPPQQNPLPPQPQMVQLGMGIMPASEERIWGLASHLSALFLPVIGPLIVLLVNQEKSPFVTWHSKETLNFHLSITIYSLICAALSWLLIPILGLFALGILMLIYAIIGGIRANEGGFIPMPITIRMVR